MPNTGSYSSGFQLPIIRCAKGILEKNRNGFADWNRELLSLGEGISDGKRQAPPVSQRHFGILSLITPLHTCCTFQSQ